MNEPRYGHDCSQCRFIGYWEQYDLYVCPESSLGGSIIARESAVVSDYQSSPVDLLRDPCIRGNAPEPLQAGFFTAVVLGLLEGK